MRILICTIAYCEYVVLQANALALRGHKVMIVLPMSLVRATLGAEMDTLLRRDVICYQYDTTKRREISLYSEMFRAINSFTPEVIHFHETGEVESLAVALRFRNLPLVVTKHDVPTHSGADSKMALRRLLIMKHLSNRADLLLVHSAVLQRELSKIDPTLWRKSMVIPHGTLSIFRHWQNEALESEPFTCLFFGRMERYRGLDNLVTIAGRLKKALPDTRIIVAGSGSELTKLKQQMTALGIFEIHDSFIPDRDVATFFQRSSLLLLPYHEASQSGVAHMAISFGLPVVATAVGAIPDLIADRVHGRIVAADDIDAFTEAMISLLTDPGELETMKRSCLELAERMEFENLAVDFEAAYLLAGTARGSRRSDKNG